MSHVRIFCSHDTRASALPHQPLDGERPAAARAGFVDADKKNQGNYYEEILRRLRPGGMILIDNVLREGRVLDKAIGDPELDAVRALNDRLPQDPRVAVVMLPIAPGLSLVRKLAVPRAGA